MKPLSTTSSARQAYDALAADYDAFTAGYRHEAWFDSIHIRAREVGLEGRRALDLACGTGKSTEPLLRRGYCVRGCDISPEMVRVARQRLPDHADSFFVADMRDLPDLDEVDLVVCLDDAMNYLLSSSDLIRALRGAARALKHGGLIVFDLNTLATYRSTFAQTFIRQSNEHFFAWRGEESADIAAGAMATAEIVTFARQGDGSWSRRSSRHHQRHHPRETVLAALDAADLECCAIHGQPRGGVLEPHAEEDEHIKFIYYARRV